MKFSAISEMMKIFFQILILTTFVLSFANGSDDDENFYFANNNNKFFYNSRKNCQPNNFFDVDFFKCRLCDPNFNLIATQQSEFDNGWSVKINEQKNKTSNLLFTKSFVTNSMKAFLESDYFVCDFCLWK